MSVQDHTHTDKPSSSCGSFFTSLQGLVLIGFLAIGGVYLWMEHRAHLLGALIWLPLLLCPLIHFFMRHGQGGDHGGSPSGESK